MNDDVVTKHKVVYMRYSVLDEAGQVMGQQDMPTGYVHGAGSGLFEEIEQGLEGKHVGDHLEVILPPEVFGERNPELVLTEELESVPPVLRYVGAEAEMRNEKGDTLLFRVVEIADGKITLDGNHPLAGRLSRCRVEVVSIRDATPDEIREGFPAEQGAPRFH